MSPTLSVLLCTYNRPELLRGALQALIDETIEKPDQVVVVNGGDARADEVVQSFMGRPNVEVKLINTMNVNLAASRNVGLPHCTGDIIAMSDDDARVAPDWVASIRRAFAENPSLGAVGGPVLLLSPRTLLERVAHIVTFPPAPSVGLVRFLPGANIAFTREAVLRLGPQDQSLTTGEDEDYAWRLARTGGKLSFDPRVVVFHLPNNSLVLLARKLFRYGRDYLRLRRKWPDIPSRAPRSLVQLPKLILFLLAFLYQPLLDSRVLARLPDRILALPYLYAASFAWRLGILAELLHAPRTTH